MGAENCNCKASESSQTAIVHRTPERKDVRRMFNRPITSSPMVNGKASEHARMKTVQRGFSEDPTVKIRFIADKGQKANALPPMKQFKEQRESDLIGKLNKIKRRDSSEKKSSIK